MIAEEGFLPIPCRRLFPLPVTVGKKWRQARWEFEVAAVDAKVYLGEDAGIPMFIENCLFNFIVIPR